jgi:hypothetical protein
MRKFYDGICGRITPVVLEVPVTKPVRIVVKKGEKVNVNITHTGSISPVCA